jgi:hypothetical protein
MTPKCLKWWVVTVAAMVVLAGCKGLSAQDSSQGWAQNDRGQFYPSQPYSAQPYPGQPDNGQAYPEQGYAQQGYPGAARQPLDAGQLEQLVAPIALYPDALVAQVLAASTYPKQVVDADRWRQAQGNAPDPQIVYRADAQNWDPSVKALTEFPQVLAQMAQNLQWVSDLGNAYYNQPQDVLEAVQVMRRRAEAAGTLRSTPQEAVQENEGNIELAPANPQVVYVPAYNPWLAYGAPVAPYPGFSLLGAIGEFLGSGVFRYGAGIAVSSFIRPWGWLAWGLDWLAHSLLFNDSPWYCHSMTVADWGFPHRGFYAYRGRVGEGGWGHEYARSGGREGRGGWGGEKRGGDNWRGRGNDPGGWHSFGGGAGRAESWNRSSNNRFAGREDGNRNFADRNYGGGNFANHDSGNREFGNHAGNSGFGERSFPSQGFASRGGYGSEYGGASNRGLGRGGAGGFRGESYRAANSGFPRGDFSQRSYGGFGGSNGKAHSGGFHLFGGGHSHNSSGGKARSSNEFGGHSGFFGGGHAPKGFGSGGFRGSGGGHAPKFHGGFGGGRSHGGGGGHFGGHGGGHGGGGHHR